MIVTLRNDFHNTSVDVRVPCVPYTLSAGQWSRVRQELCGMRGCLCGVLRGDQDIAARQIEFPRG